MEIQRGRLIDHIHLRTHKLDEMKRFYTAVLDAVGVPVVDGGDHFYADELWVDVGDPASHIHLAFQAWDQETVQKFYDAGLAAGGKDNGPPGERSYHPGYYAAFLWDPDSNNIEAVFHGRADRSAKSVVITRGPSEG